MNLIPPPEYLAGTLITLLLTTLLAAPLHAQENGTGTNTASTGPDSQPAQTQENSADTAAHRTATISDYRSISERPLFHASRRPRPEASVNNNLGDLSEKWRLSGTILLKQTPIALFSSKEQGGTPRRIEAGMPLEPSWLLDEVGPDYALVSNGEEQVRFELWQPRELAQPQTQQQKQAAVTKPDRKKLKPQIVEKAVDPKTE